MGIAGEVQARYSESRQVSLWLFGTGTISTCTATEHFSANYIAPRLDFDALLCERALRAGASWLDQVTVHALAEEQPQGVIAVGAHRGAPLRLPARIVVAADGSGSRLARQLRRSLLDQGTTAPLTGPEIRMTRFTAMRGYYEGMERLKDADGALEFYMHTEPGTYYCWVFPMDDRLANVGVIAHMQQLRAHHPDLAQALGAFLQSPAASGRSAAATLRGQLEAAPIWSGLRGTALYDDHVLCVGDAAALVHPLTAEGISSALTSGRLAAVTALSALEQGDYSLRALSPSGEALRARYETLYDTLLENAPDL